MKEILRRLELIKVSIGLEDIDVIISQIEKLKTLQIDDEVYHIIDLLEQDRLDVAVVMITKYYKRYFPLVQEEEREIKALKKELSHLEDELNYLSEQKSLYIHQIDEFNSTYFRELGTLTRKIFQEREMLLELQIRNARIEDKGFIEVFLEEAKKDHLLFDEMYREQQKYQIEPLSDAENTILRVLYAKACKLCHPDVIDSDIRDEAETIFMELNSAYQKNDLEKVKKIKKNLESGKGFEYASDKINDIHGLKAKIEQINARIETISSEIESITLDETYQRIDQLTHQGDYFNETKSALEDEYLSIQAKMEEVSEAFSENWRQKLIDWAYSQKIESLLVQEEELAGLESIDLSNKSLSVLPDEIGYLQNLKSIDLSHNTITALPDTFAELHELTHLNLSFNSLSKVPTFIGSLINLKDLDLSNNLIHELDENIGRLHNLNMLRLNDNKLVSLPQSIWELEKLQGLFLKGNNL